MTDDHWQRQCAELKPVLAWARRHPALLCLIWSLFLSAEFWALGPYSSMLLHDNADEYIPAKLSIANSIQRHDLGLSVQWACGADRLSLSKSAILDSVVFMVFPGWLAYGLILWLQRFVAAAFTLALCREYMKLPFASAACASFTYSLFPQSHFGLGTGFGLFDLMSYAALPFVIWALSRLSESKSAWRNVWAVLLGCAYSTGACYYVAFGAIILVYIWFYLFPPENGVRIKRLVLSFFAGWLFLQVPYVTAAILNASFSHRVDWAAGATGLWSGLAEEAQFIVRILRDNAMATVLIAFPALLRIDGGSALRKVSRCLVGVGIVLLLYPVLRTFAGMAVNGLATFQFNRLSLMTPFLFAVGEAAALATLRSRNGTRVYRTVVCIVLICVVGQACLIKRLTLGSALQGECFADSFVMPQLSAIRMAGASQPPFRVATIAARGLHPAFAWAAGFETADGYLNIYPERYKQFWEQVDAPLFHLDKVKHAYFQDWGSRIYLFAPSSGFPEPSSVHVSDYYRLPLLALANVKILISPSPLADPELRLLSAPTQSQREWARQKRFSRLAGLLAGKWEPVPLYIYENLLMLPRYRFVSKPYVKNDAAEILAALQTAELPTLHQSAYVLSGDVRDVSLDRVIQGDSEIVSEVSHSDRITLRVRTKTRQILVVANSYNRFWVCRVDGQMTRIFPVNHAFQGIVVPPGDHDVVFEYAPPYSPGAFLP